MVLGKLPVPGRPTNSYESRARDYCACSRCGWGCLDIFSLVYHFSFLSPSLWPDIDCNTVSKGRLGWLGGAMVLGKLPVPGRFGHFFSPLSFLSSFSLSLGDGPILTEILSQRAVKPKTTNQPSKGR